MVSHVSYRIGPFVFSLETHSSIVWIIAIYKKMSDDGWCKHDDFHCLLVNSMTNQPTKNPAAKRYERYKSIVDFTVRVKTFRVDDVRKACAAERPAFITRVVGELANEGWIVREDDGAADSYRWNSDKGEFPAAHWLDGKIFGTQLKESPEQQRPREKLLANGVETLTAAELLAILIRSGRPGESALTGGEKLAKEFDGRLRDLSTSGRAHLKSVTIAVEKTAYCQILAGIELGRRIVVEISESEPTKITCPSDAMAYCRQAFARLASDGQQEEFHIVTLDTKNKVINNHKITVGTLDASLVHPREVFRPAIRDAASSVILVHNHPSGDPTPSREDHAVTKRLDSAGELLGINVLDHIVLGRDCAVSIRES